MSQAFVSTYRVEHDLSRGSFVAAKPAFFDSRKKKSSHHNIIRMKTTLNVLGCLAVLFTGGNAIAGDKSLPRVLLISDSICGGKVAETGD
jgi:hypothetical protein